MEHKPGEAWSVPLTSKKCVDDMRSLDDRNVEIAIVRLFWGGKAPLGLL